MRTLMLILLSKNFIANNGKLNVDISVINIEAKKVLNIDNFFKSPTDYYEIIFE